MIKVSVLIKRKPGMSSEDFHRHWKETHAALACGATDFMSHIRKYVQCHQVPGAELPGKTHGGLQYDGIVELWADSMEEINRAFDSPGYKNSIQPDERNFCDDKESICMVTQEVVVKG